MLLSEHMRRCLSAAGLPIAAGFNAGLEFLEDLLDEAKGGSPSGLIYAIRRMSGDWLSRTQDRVHMLEETRSLVEHFYDEMFLVSSVMAYAFLLALTRYVPREIVPNDKGGGNLPN